MLSVALLLLFAAGSCVKCEQLTQPASVTVQPGQRLTITCQVSYSVNSYYTGWIRQPAGKGLEWIGRVRAASTSYYKDSLKNKFSIDLDTSRNIVTLNGQNMQPEDAAVYYCARVEMEHCDDYFDYWGQGTEVTVSSGTTSSPEVFPLIQCDSGTGKILFGCLARDFFPKSLTFQWYNGSSNRVDSVQYTSTQDNKGTYTGVSVVHVSSSDPMSLSCNVTHNGHTKRVEVYDNFTPPEVNLLSMPSGDTQTLVCSVEKLPTKTLTINWKKNDNVVTGFTKWEPQKVGNAYSTASILKITNTDWDSEAVYTCDVTHQGQTYKKKTSKAPITVTLNPPSPKEMFKNNQAELKCVVTGQGNSAVSETEIIWKINGQPVKGIGHESTGNSKTSKLTRTLVEWKTVDKVSCSATRQDMMPVIQELTVRRKGGEPPTVKVHILPENNSAGVTLACVVSSHELQDYYIVWSDGLKQNNGNFIDGLTFPPQMTGNGSSVTSFYTPTMEEWNNLKMFYCNVWVAGSERSMTTEGVSKAKGNSLEC
ncbi:immunoglobulin gamma-1 heavy chain-like [Embiotoca jacksoni]|uniref:immunoglobulin gamma-1 heavy chain-like n=1 Tax=Embiotoca jacksoni TaxID=100190 RepID=UPI0037045416